MNREEMEKLLGGYSAGILTPEEEQALYAAALEDQALFNALAKEQPLRDLLEDPAARAALLAALDEHPLPWYRRMTAWLVQPRALAPAAALVCVVVTATFWLTRQPKPAPVLTAQVASAIQVPAPVTSPAMESAPAPPVASIPGGRQARPSARRIPPPVEPRAGTGFTPRQLVEAAPPAAKTASQYGLQSTNQPPQPANPAQAIQADANASAMVISNAVAVDADSLPPAGATQPPPPAPQAPAARPVAVLGALALPSPLRWSLQRRLPDGEFAAADAALLQAGDAVRLRIESDAAGYVYVVERGSAMASSPVAPGTPFDAALGPHEAGRRNLELWFSSQPMTWPAAGQGQPLRFQANFGVQAGGGGGGENAPVAPAAGGARDTAVRVVTQSAGAAAARPVSISITLNYR